MRSGCGAVPCRAVQCSAVPFRAVPYRAGPCGAVPSLGACRARCGVVRCVRGCVRGGVGRAACGLAAGLPLPACPRATRTCTARRPGGSQPASQARSRHAPAHCHERASLPAARRKERGGRIASYIMLRVVALEYAGSQEKCMAAGAGTAGLATRRARYLL